MIKQLLSRYFSSPPAQTKVSRGTSLIELNIGQAVWTPRDYEPMARAGYEQNADVFTAVNLITGAAKSVPLYVAREDDRPIDPNNGLVKLLKRPNPQTTITEFIEQSIAFILLSGNRYIERVNTGDPGNQNGLPIELWVLRPDRMRVLKGAQGTVRGYNLISMPSDKLRWQPWEILHQKLFHPTDDWYGMSPLEAAGYPIDISNEGARLYKKLLQKGVPAGWIEPEGGWHDDDIDKLKSQLRARSRDSDYLFGQGIKAIHSLGFNPENARILEGRVGSKRDIAAVLRVPAEMMGDPGSKTFSNFREARKSLLTEAALPELVSLVDGLNAWLSPLFDGAMIKIDRDAVDVLQEDRNTTADRATKVFLAGLVRRNEARAEMGYEPVPDKENVYYSDIPTPVPTAASQAPKGIVGPREDKSRDVEFQSFGLISEEAKEVYWKTFDGLRSNFYDEMTRRVAERFDEERKTVLFHFRNSNEAGAIRAVDSEMDHWDVLYKDLYIDVGTEFARRVLSSFKSGHLIGAETKKVDVFTQAILNWIASEGAKRVVGVSNATKDKIRRELTEGIKLGESTFDLAKRLEDAYKQFGYVRAERIARTEVISASNLGSQTAAKSTGLDMEKEWIATFDNRTRSPHAIAHGQRKGITEPYMVKGQRLMFPGDSSMGASGDNTIQCRCTESYRVKR